ncbi:MAG: formylglycine-generating enzyme family protein [Thermodesulfobacteriota bacterium]
MAYIPAGEFLMGTSEDLEEDPFYKYGFNKPFYADATPAHKVFVDAYYIDIYEVSNEQYAKFVKATGYRAPSVLWKGRNIYPEGKANYPVTGVNWYDASEYCKWMGKRLPAEAEWEKAARGDDGRIYPWGNDFSYEKANLSTSPLVPGGTKEVDSYKEWRSPYGLYNMAGNVWEWTTDGYDPYPNTKYEFPTFKNGPKVTRGNSFSPIAHFLDEEYKAIVERFSRTTYRQYTPINVVFLDDVGFRCVKSAS